MSSDALNTSPLKFYQIQRDSCCDRAKLYFPKQWWWHLPLHFGHGGGINLTLYNFPQRTIRLLLTKLQITFDRCIFDWLCYHMHDRSQLQIVVSLLFFDYFFSFLLLHQWFAVYWQFLVPIFLLWVFDLNLFENVLRNSSDSWCANTFMITWNYKGMIYIWIKNMIY